MSGELWPSLVEDLEDGNIQLLVSDGTEILLQMKEKASLTMEKQRLGLHGVHVLLLHGTPNSREIEDP